MAKKEKKEKKGFFKEFKEFISRGNILDMAVGVIIGGAFGKIVTSLTNDIIMPLIALAMGGSSMEGLAVVLNGKPHYITDTVTGAQVVNPEALLWNYGNFLQSIIDFLIIALVVFLFIKLMMKVKTAGEKISEGAKQLAEKVKADEETEDGAAEAAQGENVSAEETEKKE